jgi:PBP4 family serine-type D-alanyl-D-alanine carboxypeptidase
MYTVRHPDGRASIAATMANNKTAACLTGILSAVFTCGVILASQSPGQPASTLAQTIEKIIHEPAFSHATFGIEFYSLDAGKPVYELNPNELFSPASTTKLLTEGTALALLGPNYRFHTRVYRTGPITASGALRGDLVLVGSGDPDLSQRIQPNGTLAFENNDHCYGGPAVPGDPLTVVEQLANQVAGQGITHVDGGVLVDATMFQEGARELGTGTVISPVVINDNILDVTATPGPALGALVKLSVSPATGYAQFVNRATTGPPNSTPDIEWASDATAPEGTHVVIVTGNMPLGGAPALFPYAVPKPSRFAELAFSEALREAGITLNDTEPSRPPDFKALASWYKPENLVAEHISPPLSEDARITLKVSQNLHASLMPYILGAVLAHATRNANQAGFNLERGFLQEAGLDLGGASQSDGAGGSRAAFFTPNFMVQYLARLYRMKIFHEVFAGLPVLGRDGTLADLLKNSPAAGHVYAKTGSYDAYDELNRDDMVTGKGLAGYLTTPDGQHLVFAIYVNRVAIPGHGELMESLVGRALAEIAAAAYMLPAPR